MKTIKNYKDKLIELVEKSRFGIIQDVEKNIYKFYYHLDRGQGINTTFFYCFSKNYTLKQIKNKFEADLAENIAEHYHIYCLKLCLAPLIDRKTKLKKFLNEQ